MGRGEKVNPIGVNVVRMACCPLLGHTWHHPDSQLFAITKFGLAKLIDQPDYKTAMPIYSGVLSDDEIVAVLSWIKAQWPPDVKARHDEINQAARKAGL